MENPTPSITDSTIQPTVRPRARERNVFRRSAPTAIAFVSNQIIRFRDMPIHHNPLYQTPEDHATIRRGKKGEESITMKDNKETSMEFVLLMTICEIINVYHPRSNPRPTTTTTIAASLSIHLYNPGRGLGCCPKR